jgi:outer membrane protease
MRIKGIIPQGKPCASRLQRHGKLGLKSGLVLYPSFPHSLDHVRASAAATSLRSSMVSFFGIFVIILCGICRPVSAQINKAYSFSLCPQFGLVYGHAEEIVYPVNTKAPMLSLLLWDMKPVFYYGLLMDFSPVKPIEKWGFFSGLSLKFGIPGPSGKIEDSDWESVENTELTSYSKHDNSAKELFLLDFSAGVSFPFLNFLLVKTFVNISYMNFRFNGENGSGTYARPDSSVPGKFHSIKDNPYKQPFSGKVISYGQEWFCAAPGVSLGFGYKEYFLAEISFMASPLVVCAGFDEHKLNVKKIQYRDRMKGGVMLEPGFKFSASVTRLLGVSWEISWRYINGTRGASYQRAANPDEPIGTGIDMLTANESGSGLSILNTALLLKVKM